MSELITIQQEVNGQTIAVKRIINVPRIGESVEVFEDDEFILSGVVKNVITTTRSMYSREIAVILEDDNSGLKK